MGIDRDVRRFQSAAEDDARELARGAELGDGLAGHIAASGGQRPDRTREIFLLNRLEGLSYTQIAARFAVSVKAIEKQMSKALAHLRRRYQFNESCR